MRTKINNQRAVAQLAPEARKGGRVADIEESRKPATHVRDVTQTGMVDEVPASEHRHDMAEVVGSSPIQRDHIPFQQFELRWNEPVGLPECPYLRRWVLTLFGYSLRLHHWTASDDQRHLHDHPWWMLVLILRGGYTDISETQQDVLSAGSIRFRNATHRHTVKVSHGCWSLLLTGRHSRNWGFYVPGRSALLRPLRYFSRYGHHPCASGINPNETTK